MKLLIIIIPLLALFLGAVIVSSVNNIDLDGIEVKLVEPTDIYGNLEVSIQDQNSEIIDLYITRINSTTSIVSDVAIDDVNITVSDVSGATQFNAINIIEAGHYYQALILAINGDVITTNVPFDYAFTTGAVVEFADWNMNIDASGGLEVFEACAPVGVSWDITRIIFSITDESAMDDGLFGGVPALSNGVVLRVKNGVTKNIFVVSDNGGFAERAYDTEYSSKAPSGLYGFKARRTFAGQDKNGVTVRLDGNHGDCLQVLLQDDITDVTKFAAVVQGHVVE